MKKLFIALSLVAFALGAQAQYQVGNSNFETTWSNNNEPGSGWYSFPSAGGDMASMGISRTKGNTTKLTGSDARNGGISVRLTSKWVGLFGIGANANGNLTTGKINMGDTAADGVNNYNYTARGTSNSCKFTGHPDAIEYWAKFSRGEEGSYNGRCHVILHGDIDYKDPYETPANEANYKIAEAKVYATPTTEWTRFFGELNYTGVESSTSYMLVNFTTNETPGGSVGDVFDIDDIKFLYYSQLSSLTVNGVSVQNFDKDTYNYTVDALYTSETSIVAVDNTKKHVATIDVTSDGLGYDEATAKYSIKVTNEEGTESHIYTIQFKVPDDGSKPYSENLYVTINGNTSSKQEAKVLVKTLDNGNINFVLKNFVLGEGDEATPVGNIAVNDIAVADDGSFTFNGGIEIEAGDDPNYSEDDWLGPGLTLMCGGSVPLSPLEGRFIGDDHVVGTIIIDLTKSPLKQMVYVHLGYELFAPGLMYVYADAQYGTFCAPFAVEIPEGVKAYTVPSVTGGVLDLNELTGTIPANTPVVLYSELEEGYSSPELFGVVEEGTPSVGLLTGVYEEGYVPVGSYVLQLKYLDDESYKVGFYKVVEDAPLYIYPNRCYLTVPASGGIKEAFFFNEDDATGIKAMVNGQKSMDNAIYNLAGQRMSKMQKGVNIVNGKKILY